MDIDVIVKHMPGLLEFKKRVEALLEGAEAGSGTAEALSGRIDVLSGGLSGLTEHVASLQQSKDGDDQKITLLVEFKDELAPIVEGLAGLKAMALWFEQNREGLEVLLSIGDGLAPATPASSTAAETASVAAQTDTAQTADAPAADPLAPAVEQQSSADQPIG